MSKKPKRERFSLNMEDLIVVVLKVDETVEDINQKGCELLEYSKREVLGKNWFDVFIPELKREEERLSFHQLINGTLQKAYMETQVLTKTGKTLSVSWHLLPVKNQKGDIKRAVLTGKEVTAHKKIQDRYIVLASFPAFNPNPIIEMDFDGNITYTNPATKKVFPRLEKDGLNQPFFSDWQKIAASFTGKISTEYTYVREIKIGVHWYLQQFSFIPIGPKIRVYAVNIDEKKKTEEALKASEEKFRSLFENMLDGYAYCQMLFNVEDEPDDFVYLEINKAFETITGLKKENVLGKKVSDAMPGTKQVNPEIFEIYGRVSKTGKPERFEIFFKPLNVWLDISVYSPKQGYFVAIFDDITQRKALEHELQSYNQRLEDVVAQRTAEYAQTNKRLTKEIMDHRKSEEGLLLRATILDNLSQAIVLTNLNGEFVYTNHAACDLFGYTCEEFMELNFLGLVKLKVSERKVLMDRLAKTREVVFEVEAVKKDGVVLPVALRLSILKTAHGKLLISFVNKV
ncbi:MAG: PAS domain-containing protein [Candidatus Bathyarchaeia archaeon]|jgi:PAS domain S-box-containing protein